MHLTMLLVFYFESSFMFYYACALSSYELYGTVNALRSSFPIILVTMAIIVTGH
jgi:hypothetical protein